MQLAVYKTTRCFLTKAPREPQTFPVQQKCTDYGWCSGFRSASWCLGVWVDQGQLWPTLLTAGACCVKGIPFIVHISRSGQGLARNSGTEWNSTATADIVDSWQIDERTYEFLEFQLDLQLCQILPAYTQLPTARLNSSFTKHLLLGFLRIGYRVIQGFQGSGFPRLCFQKTREESLPFRFCVVGVPTRSGLVAPWFRSIVLCLLPSSWVWNAAI